MDRAAIIVHIPHSSIRIPQEYQGCFLLSDNELDHELLIMTDRYVDELFAFEGVQSYVNPLSRLIMDPERFRSDQRESMAKVGMGSIYTRASNGKLLREMTSIERERILTELYDPYHAKITEMVDITLEKFDYCFIIDAHSFSSVPLPHEIRLDERFSMSRPDVCLGYEDQHSNSQMIKSIESYFIKKGYSVSHNQPFAGSFIPMKHNRLRSSFSERFSKFVNYNN